MNYEESNRKMKRRKIDKRKEKEIIECQGRNCQGLEKWLDSIKKTSSTTDGSKTRCLTMISICKIVLKTKQSDLKL